MLDTVVRVVSFVLAATFAWAGVVKLLAIDRWRTAVSHYKLPRPFELAATALTPVLEITAAVILVAGPVRVGAALVLALVAGFCLLLLRARGLHGDKVPCGCFGREQEQDVGLLLVRNALLAGLSVFVLLAERDGSRSVPLPSADEILPALLVGIGIVVSLWMVGRALVLLRSPRRAP